MTLWMSFPSIVIPEASAHEHIAHIDTQYQRIYQAYSRSAAREDCAQPLLPRAESDRETLASAAIQLLLATCSNEQAVPGIFIDCHSSAAIGGPAPSYKLALMTQLTRTLLFSLSGQAGAEVAQAFLFLSAMQVGNESLISAVQRVVPPDSRIREDGYPLADGAAAVVVRTSPTLASTNLRVLGIALAQSKDAWLAPVETCLHEVLRHAGLRKSDISWTIAHRLSETFLATIQQTLVGARWLERDVYPHVDFGSADSLISLQRVFSTRTLAPRGLGIVWFAGRFGAIGALLLEADTGHNQEIDAK